LKARTLKFRLSIGGYFDSEKVILLLEPGITGKFVENSISSTRLNLLSMVLTELEFR